MKNIFFAIALVLGGSSFSKLEIKPVASYSIQYSNFYIVKENLSGSKNLYTVYSSENKKLLSFTGYGVYFEKDDLGRVIRLKVNTSTVSGGRVYDVITWKVLGVYSPSIGCFSSIKADF